MGKIKRGGYLFYTWQGDHDPKHVHVVKNGRTVLVWNLQNGIAMKGKASRRILKILGELVREGKL